jgi:pimeloyl-ACP methyl ester carboxylesterase
MSKSKHRSTVVLVHGAWADGSSWNDIIGPLQSKGLNVLAAPIPLTSLSDDVAALDRALERTDGPVVLAAHAYAGAVIAASTNERVQSLVFIAALAPDEGETVADVSIATSRIRWRPNWHLTRMGSSGCHSGHLAPLSLNTRLPNGLRFLPQHSDPSLSRAFGRRLRDPLGK